VVVDLAHAGVTAAAFDELQEHARQSILSSFFDSSATPCRLRIVEPPVTLEVKEHAAALPNAGPSTTGASKSGKESSPQGKPSPQTPPI
jgi:hypothetical protein